MGLEEFLNFVPVNSFLELFVLYFNCVFFWGNTPSGSLLRSQDFVPHKMRRRAGTPVHYEIEYST